ncbi:probable serine/threonine-protein kinase PBL1 [Phalaenopsis equestris]|uniref:probable serine/threonine-protein kinase PBL1 n=1 Tax=Phalaenopsis equestris TaxID=78828 RepID=UPI0009E624A0|nr:probable serine/threonine-protein kinase PBL1 [Phalaenopsis equestris]
MTARNLSKAETPIGVSALAIFVCFVLFFTIKKGCLKKKHLKKDANFTELKRFRFDELKQATDSFSDERLIGFGAFGNVYRGDLGDEKRTVAIKKAHSESDESSEEFRNEIELLSGIKHKNLVVLIGFCIESRQKILVYEYVSQGCLLDYLAGKEKRFLTWQQRVNIAIGTAKGIAHLHGAKPSIIHRDLKPSNILIDEEFEAKISDFGLMKMGPHGDDPYVSTQIKGTPGYMDPAYCSSHHLNASSDVYSFGVILLQLVSSCPAIDHTRQQSEYHISNWAKPSIERGMVEDILDMRLQLEACNKEVMLKMAQLGIRCTAWEPKNRPIMSQVVKELEEALRRATNGVQLSSFSEESKSFSINSVQLQRFYIDSFENLSIQSTSFRCLDANKLSDNIEEFDGRKLVSMV